MRTSLALALVLAAAGLAAGCGPRGDPEIPVGPPPAVPMLDCGVGHASFPVTALASGTDTPQHAAIEDGLKRYVATAGQDAPRAFWHRSVDHAPWHVLSVAGDVAAVATGPWTSRGPGRHGQVWTLRRAGTQWSVDGGGDCADLEPMPGRGEIWASLSAPPGGLDRRTSSPVVLLTPRACGRTHQVGDPAIVETRHTVTVSWSVPRPRGNVTCPGLPPIRENLPLKHRLGKRNLIDASVFPPAPVH